MSMARFYIFEKTPTGPVILQHQQHTTPVIICQDERALVLMMPFPVTKDEAQLYASEHFKNEKTPAPAPEAQEQGIDLFTEESELDGLTDSASD